MKRLLPATSKDEGSILPRPFHDVCGIGLRRARSSTGLTFARAAKNAGVKRIIYLGGLGETGPDLSEHLSSRREVEEALASRAYVMVLRAAMISG